MKAEAACLQPLLLMAGGTRPWQADASVLDRARRGDRSAFDELVRRYQKRIYNLAYRILRSREDAEDVTQEAFLRAFRGLPRLRDETAFAHWLGRIASNLCLSRLRSPDRRAEVPTDPQLLPEPSAGPDDWSAEEMTHALRVALMHLPSKYRLAVTAFYLQGRSCEEAARLAGVPVHTLRTRLYRARCMLRDMLREDNQWREASP